MWMSDEDRRRYMDTMEKRIRELGREPAPPPRCPSPGCPKTMYRDCETRVLRCPMHGPMLPAKP
jgi:hypothetical protein